MWYGGGLIMSYTRQVYLLNKASELHKTNKTKKPLTIGGGLKLLKSLGVDK